MSRQQIIHRTELEHCFIVTAKLLSPHLLQPFVTYQIARDSATESTVEFFSSEAAALQAYERCIVVAQWRLRDKEGDSGNVGQAHV